MFMGIARVWETWQDLDADLPQLADDID